MVTRGLPKSCPTARVAEGLAEPGTRPPQVFLGECTEGGVWIATRGKGS